MNVAICDDNVYAASKLESIVGSALGSKSAEQVCDVFYSADALLSYLAQNPRYYQIYLLDIEMAGTDGLAAAQAIRQADQEAIIIFATTHQELMPEAFNVLAFQFLVKPYEEEKAQAILLRALETLEARKTLFQYVVRKKVFTLYLSQIEYLESVGRKVILHTTDGQSHEYYGTLKEALEKTGGLSFAQVHNSYVVNLDYIDTVDGQGVQLRSGVQILITKKFHQSFHAAYRNYILMRTR